MNPRLLAILAATMAAQGCRVGVLVAPPWFVQAHVDRMARELSIDNGSVGELSGTLKGIVCEQYSRFPPASASTPQASPEDRQLRSLQDMAAGSEFLVRLRAELAVALVRWCRQRSPRDLLDCSVVSSLEQQVKSRSRIATELSRFATSLEHRYWMLWMTSTAPLLHTLPPQYMLDVPMAASPLSYVVLSMLHLQRLLMCLHTSSTDRVLYSRDTWLTLLRLTQEHWPGKAHSAMPMAEQIVISLRAPS